MQIPSFYFKFIANEKIVLFLYKIAFTFQLLLDTKTPSNYKRVIWQVRNHSMVNYPRLVNIITTTQQVVKNGIDGDYVECGVWKGGCSALFAFMAHEEGKNLRTTYLFDSFEGLPQPTIQDGQGAATFAHGKNKGSLKTINKNVGTIEDVRSLFKKLGLHNYKIIKGWFQSTLPENTASINAISILRLDGDWYESTKVCLEYLYDKVSVGGYILVDDYNFWPGCKKAVDEFFAKRNILPNIKRIDASGVSIKKYQ